MGFERQRSSGGIQDIWQRAVALRKAIHDFDGWCAHSAVEAADAAGTLPAAVELQPSGGAGVAAHTTPPPPSPLMSSAQPGESVVKEVANYLRPIASHNSNTSL